VSVADWVSACNYQNRVRNNDDN